MTERTPQPPRQARSERVYVAPREWTRVHPVSPFLGVWPVIGAVLFYMLATRAPDWVTGGTDDEITEAINATHLSWLVIIGFIVLVMAAIAGFGYLNWRFNQYRIGDDAVYQRKGVLFRQQRQARLDRLQAVDVVQPLVARLVGFGAIRIEVAGGENSGVALEFLRIGDAEALRNEIIELAAGYKRRGSDDGEPGTEDEAKSTLNDGEPIEGNYVSGDNIVTGGLRSTSHLERTARPAAAERPVYAVPLSRLIYSILLSWPTFWLVLTPFWLVAAVLIFRIDIENLFAALIGTSLATAVPVLFGLVGYFWTQLNRGFGFTAGISQDGIRLRHGLLETRRQTVPPGRVQAVRLRQSWWWRKPGWWEVTINVAGYQDNQEAVSTLLPVGSVAEALEAVWLVMPDLGLAGDGGAESDSVIAYAMSGTGGEQGFTPSPRRSRFFDLLQWKQRGVRATENALIIRSGRFVKEVSIVPHERTQSMALAQGPLQRRLDLATVEIHSTNGPVKPVAQHLSMEDAVDLIESQSERARNRRRRQTPEQWMMSVGLND